MRKRKFLPKKRRMEKKTNYKKRLSLIQSNKHRLIIRKMLSNILVQFIRYEPNGDKVEFSYDAKALNKVGWKGHKGNISSAYLTGLACGLKAKTKIKEAVLDLGLNQSIKGSTLYAALKGVLDAGIKIPYSEDVLPKDERIKGQHIEEHAKKIAKEDYKKQFSGYIKNNVKPEEISKHFEEIKSKLMKGT